MKKKYILLIGVILSIIIIINAMPSNNNEIKTSLKALKQKSETLSIMYEKEAGTGEYYQKKEDGWLRDGYIFNDKLSKCKNGSKITYNKDENKVYVEASNEDSCYVYFDKKHTLATKCKNQNMAECFKDNYELDENLYYHDNNLTNGANDNSVRYTGANPNNYVCFGSDETTCPTDNLYRIIGVFNETIVDALGNDTGKKEYKIKLIKSNRTNSDVLGTDGDYYGRDYTYYWNYSNGTDSKNNWADSRLNKTNLNKNYINYLNNIDTKWVNMIDTTKWSIGGIPYLYTDTVKQIVDEELSFSTTYIAKIGLMYVSDYGYSTIPDNWTLALYKYDNESNTNNNWLRLDYDLTITRKSTDKVSIFTLYTGGRITGNAGAAVTGYVRPTFYLSPDVIYIGGSGTASDPMRISLS